MRIPNRFTAINDKIMTMKHIKSYFVIIASLSLCIILTLVGFNVFGAQNHANEETTEGKLQKQVYIPWSEEESTAEETVSEEPVSEELEAETVQEIIPVQNLVISTVDLSVPEENNVEVVSETPEEVVTFPTNEISKLVQGIDVSSWQGEIDWAQVKADGIDFAMIKVGGRSISDGELYIDSCFENNIQGALANGIQVGIYFFSQAISEQEALEEASLVVEYIKKYHITYPVTFDWERGKYQEYENGPWIPYRVNNYDISNDTLTNIVKMFCDTVANNGYSPMVYFCRSDWYNSVNGLELSPKYKSWLAIYWGEYYDDPDAGNRYDASSGELPKFDYSFQMWQYTSRGHVAGIRGRVDMDIALFTYANYKIDKSPVTLTVPSTTITTNVGVLVDLMKGVSATNSIGYDVTKDISIAVIDKDGDDVSGNSEYAINNPGKYTVYYRYKDPAGEKKEVIVIYNVRNIPTLTLKLSSITYSYDSASSAVTNKDAVLKLISDNAKALSYEDKVITVKTDAASIIPDVLVNGIYTVTYTADDGLGLTTSASVEVTIKNVNAPTGGSIQSGTESSTQ